jgi:hypothetical protein
MAVAMVQRVCEATPTVLVGAAAAETKNHAIVYLAELAECRKTATHQRSSGVSWFLFTSGLCMCQQWHAITITLLCVRYVMTRLWTTLRSDCGCAELLRLCPRLQVRHSVHTL